MRDFASEMASQEALARGERSFRRNIGAALTTGLFALLVLAAAAVFLYQRERGHAVWVQHTYEAQTKIAVLATLAERLETARRGYMITPRPNYWSTYQDTRRALPAAVDDFAAFTIDNAKQQALAAQLRGLLAQKMAQMRDTIELAHEGSLEKARLNFLVGQDHHVTERMRQLFATMSDEERRLLGDRVAAQQRSTTALLGVILATTALLAAVAGGSVALVRRYSDELQRAQQALQRMNSGLEEAVKERTVDLTRANDEIQRFAYIVSHDLRSPLVNIMGFTSELEAAAPPLRKLIEAADAADPELVSRDARQVVEEELPEAIGFIRKSTQKMDRLINAILKLSREGRRNLTLERLDMDALAQGVAATLYQLAEARDAVIAVEPGIPEIVADRVMVEQVLSNLVENGVKYLKPGRPGRVVVRGRNAGGRVLIEVEDNGRGVDPKDHERIFDLFRRSGAQDQPGEGIGLAHVRALVYRMGGVISCVSELDQGATFRVSLPRQPAPGEGPA